MYNFCLDFIKRSLAESTAEHIVTIVLMRGFTDIHTQILTLKLTGQKSFAIRWDMYLTTNISAMALIQASVLSCDK